MCLAYLDSLIEFGPITSVTYSWKCDASQKEEGKKERKHALLIQKPLSNLYYLSPHTHTHTNTPQLRIDDRFV